MARVRYRKLFSVNSLVALLLLLASVLLWAWLLGLGARNEDMVHVRLARYRLDIYRVFVPLPVAGLALGFYLAHCWRQRGRTRRLREGLCVVCGYDLRADETGVCPECGRATPASSQRGFVN